MELPNGDTSVKPQPPNDDQPARMYVPATNQMRRMVRYARAETDEFQT